MSLFNSLRDTNHRPSSRRPEAARFRPQLEILEGRGLPSPFFTPLQQQGLIVAGDVYSFGLDFGKLAADMGVIETMGVGAFFVSSFSSDSKGAILGQTLTIGNDILTLRRDFQSGANLASVTGDVGNFLLDGARVGARVVGGEGLALISDSTKLLKDVYKLGVDIEKLFFIPSTSFPPPKGTPQPAPPPAPQPTPSGAPF
jgi:hypothetical protein